MTTVVLLAFLDGQKEFVAASHVHGCRDGRLLIARGEPGGGLDAEVVRTVPVSDLSFAETCTQDEPAEHKETGGPEWIMTWSGG